MFTAVYLAVNTFFLNEKLIFDLVVFDMSAFNRLMQNDDSRLALKCECI